MFLFFIFLLQPRLVNFPRIKIVSLFIDTHHLLDIKLPKYFHDQTNLTKLSIYLGVKEKKKKNSKAKVNGSTINCKGSF